MTAYGEEAIILFHDSKLSESISEIKTDLVSKWFEFFSQLIQVMNHESNGIQKKNSFSVEKKIVVAWSCVMNTVKTAKGEELH